MRIGILLNSDRIHAYEAKIIEEIKCDHDLIELRYVSADPDPSDVGFSTILWRSWAKKHLYPNMHALKTYSFDDLAGLHDKLDVHFKRKGKYSFYADPESLSKLPQIDVVISFQYRIIRGDFLNHPKHGVWSFHTDDEMIVRGGPSSFWELYYGYPIGGAILQRLTDKLDGGRIIRKGWFANDLISLPKTRDKIFFEVARWVKSALNEVAHFGKVQEYTSNTTAPIYRDPTNVQMLRFLAVIYWRKVRLLVENFFFYEAWNIAITNANPLIDESEYKNSIRWLPELKWPLFQADPFWNGNLLLEEYDYKSHKGTIKSVAFDSGGSELSRNVFISSDKHHSYPFVFGGFNENGDIRVIPESLLAKATGIFDKDGEKTGSILEGLPVIDPSLYFDGKKYWLFCTQASQFTDGNSLLYIYYSDNILGPYDPHLLNPVKSDVRCSRPGGSFFTINGELFRPAQDCSITYGGALSIQRVDTLTTCEFSESTVHILKPTENYPQGIHHFADMNGKYLIDGKRTAFSLARLVNRLTLSGSPVPILNGTISSTLSLSPANWGDACAVKGVYEDGWCQRTIVIAFELESPMELQIDVEFPGWQSKKFQVIKIKAKKYSLKERLSPGVKEFHLRLEKGMHQITIRTNYLFDMPSPDTRRCAMQIKCLRFIETS